MRNHGISVVIPTFNRANFILDAIKSVAQQVNSQPQIIVVDDGSTDNTQEKLQRSEIDIEYYYLPHKGVSVARNYGIEKANGEFLVFLDSDDIIEPNKLLLQSTFMQNNNEISVVYSQWRTSWIGTNDYRDHEIDFVINPLATLIHKNIAPLHTCMFRKQCVVDIGGFDIELDGCEDWAILLELALNGNNFGFIPQILAVYRRHHDNFSSDFKTVTSKILRLISKTFSDPRLPSTYRQYMYHVKSIAYLESIHRCLINIELSLAKEMAREALELLQGENGTYIGEVKLLLNKISDWSQVDSDEYDQTYLVDKISFTKERLRIFISAL